MFYSMQSYQETKKYTLKKLLAVQYFFYVHNCCAYQRSYAQNIAIFVQVVGQMPSESA